MRDYRYDHVHLRSANPSAMADFFEVMFSAEVTRDIYPRGTLYPGQQRIRMRVGGQTVLIAPAHPNDATGAAPTFPYYGLEHMGLTVDNVDAACADGCSIRCKGGRGAHEAARVPLAARLWRCGELDQLGRCAANLEGLPHRHRQQCNAGL